MPSSMELPLVASSGLWARWHAASQLAVCLVPVSENRSMRAQSAVLASRFAPVASESELTC